MISPYCTKLLLLLLLLLLLIILLLLLLLLLFNFYYGNILIYRNCLICYISEFIGLQTL